MSGRIPQHFIDELISRTDIVELINQRVPLKKAGRNHMACCPFHNEKTPSFNVSQQKQFYHCFGCGANGNALSFLIEYDRLDFLEAVDLLAQHHGLEIPREGGGVAQRGPDHKPLYAVMDKAAEYYQQQLRGAEPVISYLQRRKISGETAKRFGIGYAPAGWENVNRAVDATGSQHKNLVITGMLIERDEAKESSAAQQSSAYDRFRDRLMFPIRDARGRTIAFGGRVLGDEKPKYLNSPETPIFHKGKELYGLFEMKQLSESFGHVLVVEGYMDVVALAEHGVNNSVATLGTATSADHLQRLYRSFGEIVFCFDGDAAGKKAAWRALETVMPLLQQTRQARFLFLPDGEDPDSLVQSVGADVFRQRVKAALPMSRYLLDTLELDCDMVSLDGRAKFAEVAKGYVNKMPNGVFKDMLAKEVAKRAGVDEAKVTPVQKPAQQRFQPQKDKYQGVREQRRSNYRKQDSGSQGAPSTVGARNVSTVSRAIRLLVNNPGLGQYAPPPAELQHVQDTNISVLIAMLEYCQNHPNAYPSQVAEQWRDSDHANLVLSALMNSPELDTALQEQEFGQCMEKLAGRKQVSRLDFLLELSRREPLSAEQKNELRALLSAKSQ